MEMFWFIPTTGDGRYLGSSHGSRLTDYTYLRQIAQAVDDLGYGAGTACPYSSWLVGGRHFTPARQLESSAWICSVRR